MDWNLRELLVQTYVAIHIRHDRAIVPILGIYWTSGSRFTRRFSKGIKKISSLEETLV